MLLTDSLRVGYVATREALFAKLRAVLIPRANDKLASVRVQTVYALKRIQEPDEAKDKVTAELLRLMVSDPSK